MSARSPVVSVVLPTHDRMPYLREAVDSVRAQSLRDWELIVVDDGSTDATAAYLGSIRDPRVRHVAIEHTGLPAKVRNEGLARARGEYIAFLDSDDVWHPRKLEVQLAALRSEAQYRWSYSDVNYMNAASALLPREQFSEFRVYSGQIFERLITHDTIVTCSSVIAARAMIHSVGGFDESLAFGEDFDLWLRLAECAHTVGVTEPLVDMRRHHSYSAGRVDTTRCVIRVFAKHARRAANRRIRRLCRRQQAFHGVRLANQLLALGHRTRAILSLCAAVGCRPMFPWLWRTFVKSVLPGRLAQWVARGYHPLSP